MTSLSPKPIKAFLLAGGLGTRLRPLTDSVPKCLLPIQGKPLLQYWLENLAEAGVSEVLLNTHWLHLQVETFLREFRIPGLKVLTFYEPELLGSAGTIAANAEWAMDAGAIPIIYADNFTDTPIKGLIEFHCSQAPALTLGVFQSPTPERCGIVTVNNEGIVTSFEEKPKTPRSSLAAGGMYIASPATIKQIAEMQNHAPRPFDLGFHVLPSLVGGMRIFPLSKNFIDVGTPESYEVACKMFS